ncbi:cyclopropane-fatty-acyl-phospholipid synthase family protein [Hyphomicrobium sp.]|uniref:cyclopropane-fatty-acyl-phospholipid synthase family protein n=1 Tax=Hyphomicrobium sp. TaxID=82 RepID=UPI002D766CFC|nr:cyclopropane-fatty-acyl-phospholipid synthase family protein [Hyphomicrobium sp.]HET6390250.1 cyclopropane-fatty-acyl-phospholipid synthase family protein [Hyphomicrobium sp.]
MKRALQSLLDRCIQKGTLTLEFPSGERVTAGDGSGLPLTVKLMDAKATAELFFNPQMALGELFTDGRLQVSGGSVYDLLDLLGRNLHGLTPPQFGRMRILLRNTLGRWHLRNSQRRARANVQYHYDIDDRIYQLFLDPDRQYSCAYFDEPGQSLDEAQLAKKRHIAAKLLLKPGLSVLDIGSGWGGLALYLADIAGASVTGLTLSPEQLKVAQRRAGERGLTSQVEFRLEDYRAPRDSFDRIVSVGMFEHVGLKDYDVYFDTVRRNLKDDGVALIHSIGRMDGRFATNPWFAKYIFPGSYVPSLAEVFPAIEQSGLIVTDVEILRLHYADTLAAWRSRFMARRTEAATVLDERFCRMWEFYLAAAEAGFRYGGLMVFQIQLAKTIDAVPRVRSYMSEAEDKLRQREREMQLSSVAAE